MMRSSVAFTEHKENIRCESRCDFWSRNPHRDTICSNFADFVPIRVLHHNP